MVCSRARWRGRGPTSSLRSSPWERRWPAVPSTPKAWRYYEEKGFDLDELERRGDAREAVPLVAPLTVLYSKKDGIVVWQSCIDEVNARAEHVEIDSTHVGMGFSPAAYSIIARRLAELAG